MKQEIVHLINSHLAEEHYLDLELNNVDNYVRKIFELAEIRVKRVNGQIVGMIAYYKNDPKRTTGFLSLLLVSPSFYRRGFATSLMREAMSDLRKSHYETLKLEVSKLNEKALKFYAKWSYAVEEDYQDRFVLSVKL